MKQILTLEFLKLRKLRTLHVIMLIYVVILPAALYGINYTINSIFGKFIPDDWSALQFPDVWSIATYAASYFNVLMGVLIVLIISNEYRYKTMRQSVINGLSERKVIAGNFVLVLTFSIVITLYTFIVGLIFGMANTTGEVAFTSGLSEVPKYFVQTLCYFSFAFLIVVLLRKTALSIVIFVLAFVAESIIGIVLTVMGLQNIYTFFPLNAFSRLIPFPLFKQLLNSSEANTNHPPFYLDTSTNIILCLGYMIVFFFISYTVLKKRDL